MNTANVTLMILPFSKHLVQRLKRRETDASERCAKKLPWSHPNVFNQASFWIHSTPCWEGAIMIYRAKRIFRFITKQHEKHWTAFKDLLCSLICCVRQGSLLSMLFTIKSTVSRWRTSNTSSATAEVVRFTNICNGKVSWVVWFYFMDSHATSTCVSLTLHSKLRV